MYTVFIKYNHERGKGMKNKQRLISAMLASVIAAGTIGCGSGNSENATATESAPDITDSSSEETTSGDYVKPDKFFDGQTVSFLLWTESTLHFGTEETNGDVINDAVYERNAKVQELFDVKFSYDSRSGAGNTYAAWLNTLNSSILAGDNAYQLAGGYGYRLAGDTLNDSFQNLKANPYIDFSKPWWPSNIIEAADIGGRMNLCFGNLDPTYYDTTYAMFFNKQLAENIGAGDLYSMVDDGTWTIDKMFSLAISGALDIDGDTKIGEGDIYGYVSNDGMCVDAYIQACDIKITERGKDDIPQLTGLSERYINSVNKLRDFVYNSGAVWVEGFKDDKMLSTFGSGKALFYPNLLAMAHQLRDMSDDFGILPYPKYDKAQERYITYNAIGNSTAFVAPITSDEELVGCILEALAYYGWKDILPEYYERALKGKAARDNASEAMLDIVFSNIEYDFTQIYSFNFGDCKSPSMLMRNAVGGNKDITSLWAKDENLYKSTMDSLIEALK